MSDEVIKLSELWPFGVVLFIEIVDVYRSKTFKKLINKYTLCFYAAFSVFVIRKLVFLNIDKPDLLFFVMNLLFAVPFGFLFIYYAFYRLIPLFMLLFQKAKLFQKDKGPSAYLRYQKELKESSRMFWFVLLVTLMYILPHITSLLIFFQTRG